MKKSSSFFWLRLRTAKQKKSSRNGFSLIEVLLSLVILAIFMGASVSLFLSADRGSKVDTDYLRASFLLQEGVEALRSIRDANYLNLTDGTHGLARAGSTYQLVVNPDVTANAFTRTITIASSYRDGNGAIAESGTLDPQMKKISVRVDFTGLGGITRTVSTSTYLADSSSAEITHTLLTDFSSVNTTDVSAVTMLAPPTNNGGLKLDTTYTPSGFFSSADVGDHGNDIATKGVYALVTTEKKQEGLVIVDTTDPSALKIVSRLDIGDKGRGIGVSGNMAAVLSEKDAKSLSFVNIANPAAPVVVSDLNIGAKGNELIMNGTTAFVTVDKENAGLVIVNYTNPAAPTVLKTVDIGEKGEAIGLYQNFLVVGVEHNGVRVYDVSNPSAPSLVQSFALGGGYANGIAIDFPYVYMSTDGTTKDLYIARMNDQGSLTLLSTMDFAGHHNGATDIAVNGTQLYTTLHDNDSKIAILDVQDPANPAILEYKDIHAKARAVSVIGNYIGVATDTANKGFVLVGAGTEGFASAGNYISDPIDTGSASTEYLLIRFGATLSPNSSVTIQLRSADTSNGLSSASWSSAYNVSPSAVTIPSKRYFEYRVNLTSDGNSSPTLDSLTIEYLP